MTMKVYHDKSNRLLSKFSSAPFGTHRIIGGFTSHDSDATIKTLVFIFNNEFKPSKTAKHNDQNTMRTGDRDREREKISYKNRTRTHIHAD